jgi:hypothetical protein
MEIFLSPTSQTFLLFCPPRLGDHFSLFSDPTSAIVLLSKRMSTPWHFRAGCHELLFVVAKVIYSAPVLLLWRTPRFRHLSFSFYFHLSDFTHSSCSGWHLFPFNHRTPSSQPAPLIKACSAHCFFHPTLCCAGRIKAVTGVVTDV